MVAEINSVVLLAGREGRRRFGRTLRQRGWQLTSGGIKQQLGIGEGDLVGSQSGEDGAAPLVLMQGEAGDMRQQPGDFLLIEGDVANLLEDGVGKGTLL